MSLSQFAVHSHRAIQPPQVDHLQPEQPPMTRVASHDPQQEEAFLQPGGVTPYHPYGPPGMTRIAADTHGPSRVDAVLQPGGFTLYHRYGPPGMTRLGGDDRHRTFNATPRNATSLVDVVAPPARALRLPHAVPALPPPPVENIPPAPTPVNTDNTYRSSMYTKSMAGAAAAATAFAAFGARGLSGGPQFPTVGPSHQLRGPAAPPVAFRVPRRR